MSAFTSSISLVEFVIPEPRYTSHFVWFNSRSSISIGCWSVLVRLVQGYLWQRLVCGGMWYVVAFFFLFFVIKGRERGKACIGSLSKSRIHDFHGECFCLKTESKGLRSVYKKPQVESSFRWRGEADRSYRQTDRHPYNINKIGIYWNYYIYPQSPYFVLCCVFDQLLLWWWSNITVSFIFSSHFLVKKVNCYFPRSHGGRGLS